MSLNGTGILCAHLVDKDGLTCYLISELPPIGICGVCFALYGRAANAIPKDILEPMPLRLFQRRKEKAYPVYNRVIDRREAP